MNGLHSTFGTRLDFINLNVDNSDHNVARATYGLANRSTYKLISPTGTVIRTWAGPLNQSVVASEIEQILSDLGF